MSVCDIEVRSAMAFTRSARVIVVLPSQKRVGATPYGEPCPDWWMVAAREPFRHPVIAHNPRYVK